MSDLANLAHSSLLKSQKVRKFCASALLSPRTAVPFVQHFLSTLRTTSGTLGFNMAFQWSETNNFKFHGALCMHIIIFSIRICTCIALSTMFPLSAPTKTNWNSQWHAHDFCLLHLARLQAPGFHGVQISVDREPATCCMKLVWCAQVICNWYQMFVPLAFTSACGCNNKNQENESEISKTKRKAKNRLQRIFTKPSVATSNLCIYPWNILKQDKFHGKREYHSNRNLTLQ